MKILFLTLSAFDDINSRDIYSDLMRELIRRGCEIYIAKPVERRLGQPSSLTESQQCKILKIKTLNITKTNIIEKGIGTLLLEYQFDRAIRRHWGDVKFDMVLYSTPPITFNKVISRIKRRCNCSSYLMLKDIFPQNAVDLGMMKQGSLIYRLFRNKEHRLYQLSDRIGCMSPANCDYVLKHNPTVDPAKVELCPNAVELVDTPPLTPQQRTELLSGLGIPSDQTLFIYGGNLGKPQGVGFLMEVVKANEQNNTGKHIVIVGNGTEYPRLRQFFDNTAPRHATLLKALPKDQYDKLIQCCDVGLIFLDPRFTIPNYPSRLLSYLENRMPVLLATDPNTDMGKIATENGFGLWAQSGDIDTFMRNMNSLTPDLVKQMGENGYKFLLDNYTVETVANTILKK